LCAPRCARLGVTEGGSVLVAKTREGYPCPGPLATTDRMKMF